MKSKPGTEHTHMWFWHLESRGRIFSARVLVQLGLRNTTLKKEERESKKDRETETEGENWSKQEWTEGGKEGGRKEESNKSLMINLTNLMN